MIKKLSVLSILCLIVIANTVFPAEQSPENSDSQGKKTKAISITMFIPGIHQLKSGQYVKGILLLGSFAGCIAGTVIYNNKGNNWYQQYLQSTNVEEIIRLRERIMMH